MGASPPTWHGYHHQLLADTTERAYLVPNSSTPGASNIIRNLKSKHGFPGYLKDSNQNDLDTNWKLFEVTLNSKHANSLYCAYRPFTNPTKDIELRGPYEWFTYADFAEYAKNFGCALRESLQIPPKSNIGIYAMNRPEWYMIHVGNMSQSYATTALYDTLGPNAVSYIIHHAQVPVIVCEKNKLPYVWQALQEIQDKRNQKNNNHNNTNTNYNVNSASTKTSGAPKQSAIIEEEEEEEGDGRTVEGNADADADDGHNNNYDNNMGSKSAVLVGSDSSLMSANNNDSTDTGTGTGTDASANIDTNTSTEGMYANATAKTESPALPPSYADASDDAAEHKANDYNNNNNGGMKDEDIFSVRYVIQMDFDNRFNNTHEMVDPLDRQKAKEEFGIELLGLSEVLALGKKCRQTRDLLHTPLESDTAFLMYTSGTTGVPKGVILSHGAFSATCASVLRQFPITHKDSILSYLPLAHIFEAAAQAMITCRAAKVAYFQGNLRKIGIDWKEIRPTLLMGVPRVFAKTYDKFLLKVSNLSAIKKFLIDNALEASEKAIRNNGARSAFYDKVVWEKLAPEIGFEHVRIVMSGGAPLPPRIAEFLRIILPNARVVQGYALTETCALATIGTPENLTLGHVGVPADNAEIRLVNAPECNYLVTDLPHARGEIQIRGSNMMHGYYKMPEKTAKVLSADGWFSTGDIGRINPNRTLSIIDRRKNMFKTSHGEYVASEKIEIEYEKTGTVGQIWLYGNSFKSFVVAIVVPDALVLQRILADKKIWTVETFSSMANPNTMINNKSNNNNNNSNDGNDSNTDANMNANANTAGDGTTGGPGYKMEVASEEYLAHFEKLCEENRQLIHDLILKDMQSTSEKGLLQFERVRDIRCEFRLNNLLMGFTIEGDCLTPTFKLKRPAMLRKYLVIVQQLYAKNGEAPNENEEWGGK